ncbi:unnamed protein product [Mucor fragilis]
MSIFQDFERGLRKIDPNVGHYHLKKHCHIMVERIWCQGSATGTMFTTAPTIPHASTCEGSCLPSSPSTSTTTLTCASPRRRSSSF